MDKKKDVPSMTHRLPVLLTLRERKNLEEIAEHYGETMSGVIKRLIIEEYTRYKFTQELAEKENRS